MSVRVGGGIAKLHLTWRPEGSLHPSRLGERWAGSQFLLMLSGSSEMGTSRQTRWRTWMGRRARGRGGPLATCTCPESLGGRSGGGRDSAAGLPGSFEGRIPRHPGSQADSKHRSAGISFQHFGNLGNVTISFSCDLSPAASLHALPVLTVD